MTYKTISVAGGRKKKIRVHNKIHFFRTKTAVQTRTPRYAAKAVHQLKQEARAPKVRQRLSFRGSFQEQTQLPCAHTASQSPTVASRLRLCYTPLRLMLVLGRPRIALNA